jgi:hypothetical protein
MSARRPELLEGAVDLGADEIRVRSGFRVVTTELLAGGPVELEFFAESVGASPLHLAVSGDRMRQRPGQFTFAATFEGSPLADPMADAPDMGGPVGVVQVSPDRPWRQPLILNQFIRLEETRARLGQGAEGLLDLACRRPLALAADEAHALSQSEGGPAVAVDLSFYLRRDDAALEALAARLRDEVMHGPLAERERPLALLLSMRSRARAQIGELTGHPDPNVSNRARQALALSD